MPPVAGERAVAPAEELPAPAPGALDFLERDARQYRETPPEVERELEHFRAAYSRLPPLEHLPDFLSLNALLKLHPDAESEGLREQIREQLAAPAPAARAADVAFAPLRGAPLDDDGRLTVLWIHGSLTQVLATFEGDRLVGRAVVQRGEPFLGEVLAEGDGPRSEVLVRSITSMSVCCHPESLLVFRVGRRGALRQVLSFELGHSEVGPGVRWDFLNHFEFDAPARRVVVTRVFPQQGQRWELVFDERAGKYRQLSGAAPRSPAAPLPRKNATEL